MLFLETTLLRNRIRRSSAPEELFVYVYLSLGRSRENTNRHNLTKGPKLKAKLSFVFYNRSTYSDAIIKR